MSFAGGRRNLPALLVGLILVGCKTAPERDYPADPLLLSRRPTNGDVTVRKPLLIAQSEPLIPPGPPLAFARVPRSPASQPVHSAEPNIRGIAYRTPLPDAVQVLNERQRLARLTGCSGDYRFMQGVLETQPNDRFVLRFGASAVVLLPDARLARFQDGDLVFVHGELATEGASDTSDPPYRVHLIWPVRMPQ